MSLHTWFLQGPCNSSSCTIYMLTGAELPQAKKVLCLCTLGHFGLVQLFMTLWTLACQASLSVGFSRQEYWIVLSSTGCHTLLEHYISCCPSCHLPWVPGAARTPVTQAAAPPHVALTGANPSCPGQPQVLNPSGRPTCRGGNKTMIETQGWCD